LHTHMGEHTCSSTSVLTAPRSINNCTILARFL
jgi:hypothetical protein